MDAFQSFADLAWTAALFCPQPRLRGLRDQRALSHWPKKFATQIVADVFEEIAGNALNGPKNRVRRLVFIATRQKRRGLQHGAGRGLA
jgi:hypothetical protein